MATRVSQSATDTDISLRHAGDGEPLAFIDRRLDTLPAENREELRRHARGLAEIVEGLHLHHEMVTAAALYPLADAGLAELDEIGRAFGDGVARLLRDLIRLPGPEQIGQWERDALSSAQAEGLRKMLLAMVRDIRVVIIRLADQVWLMRSVKDAPEETRRRAATETREIFAPLANRLGIWQLKWELEDLALRFLDPATYHRIASWLRERRAERESYIDTVVRTLGNELREAGIPADVKGRPKHIYSIWRKMHRKGVTFGEVYDVRAVRVLVDTIPQCYAVLGIVHGLWRHIPREFDDYIANPKENGYQSLHTAVIGPGEKSLEIQIRTRAMHQESELGVAAHWRYKEGGQTDPGLEEKIAWLRQLLEAEETEETDSDFIDRFKGELFDDRVYVLSPRGDIFDLPRGATPVDFAYHVHTDVGHRCRGARVSGKMVPLTRPLETGDQVEIITGKQAGPSRDWLIPQLGYIASSRARNKVRQWFRHRGIDERIRQGRAQLDRELQRLRLEEVSHEELVRQFKYQTVDEMLAAIGNGDITSSQIAARLEQRFARSMPPRRVTRPPSQRARRAGRGITIEGVGNLVTHIARCCGPVPGEPIVGFITRHRGVTIHRRDCRAIQRLDTEARDRLIEVDWGRDPTETYPVDIEVEALDRRGLLNDITATMSHEKVNITAVHTEVDEASRTAVVRVSMEIDELEQLSRVLHRVNQLPNVIRASRH